MKLTKTLILLIILQIFVTNFYAQESNLDLNKLSREYAKQSFGELKEFFSIPNDANYPDQIEPNIQWSEKAFKKRGFSTKRLETSSVPLLLAEKKYSHAVKTLLVYLQIDGQPVDPSKWNQADPYIPALKSKDENGEWEEIPWSKLEGDIELDWRIFSRSSSDARGPVMMFLKAMDILNDNACVPNFNIKVILDFEEELGSPQLPNAVKDFSEDLSADMLVIFDGPRHLSNKPTLTYGARGIATISLEVFGPREPLHSGNYGNFATNPALKLSKLLASMWDDDGRVVIPGWYDGIEITDEVKEILSHVPDNDEQFKIDFGIADTDNIGNNFQESMQYPALGILGMEAGWVGKEVRTIIPSTAIAELNIRLVVETDGNRMIELVKNFIEKQGYILVDNQPTEAQRRKHSKIARFNPVLSYAAFRTDFDSEIGGWLRKGMRSAFGKDPIEIRTSGGSIPISPFVTTLNLPAVAVPTVNPDNNQHSPNENLRLGNYIDGIKTIAAILIEPL